MSYRRVTITITGQEEEAIRQMAERDLRSWKDCALLLIRRQLVKDGLLPDSVLPLSEQVSKESEPTP